MVALAKVTVLDHPLAEIKLSALRAEGSSVPQFRSALQDLALLLLVEASKDWPTSRVEIKTPLQSCAGAELARPVVLVPILRAGLGLLDGMLRILPQAQVGHLGLYRDEKTLRPVTYYSRLPPNISEAEVLLLDPMLATGHSACAALLLLKERGAKSVRLVCVVACPAGISQVHAEHPEIEIVTAAIDPELNSVGYIVPGLGDAGDRYFGTT